MVTGKKHPIRSKVRAMADTDRFVVNSGGSGTFMLWIPKNSDGLDQIAFVDIEKYGRVVEVQKN